MSREGGGRKGHGGRWRGEEINRVADTETYREVMLLETNQDYNTLGRTKQHNTKGFRHHFNPTEHSTEFPGGKKINHILD